MNYFNYFTEIEDAFVRRRGKHLLLSPMDWALIESWKELKVPLHVNRQWVFGPPNMPSQPAVMVSRRQNHRHCLGHETPLIKLQTVIKWMLEQ